MDDFEVLNSLDAEGEVEAVPVEPSVETGMANIVNKLIIDEWEAISGYNDASATAIANGMEDVAKLLSDISKEEAVHVGELQQLLKQLDPNAAAIAEGEDEAEEKLEDSNETLDELTTDELYETLLKLK